MEYINDYADVSNYNDNNNDDIENGEVSLNNFIDDIEIENDLADSYDLPNVMRSISVAKNGAFSE